MSNGKRLLMLVLGVPVAFAIASLATVISDELLDDYYTVSPWVVTNIEGDKDGFGLGLVEGDFIPVGLLPFDAREPNDPAFTDTWPIPFTDPENLSFSYTHTFEPPPGPFDATLKIFSLGIQDGDDQVAGSDTDIRLYADGVEIPNAFDDVDQFDRVDSDWVEIAGTVVTKIPADVVDEFLDGSVEFTYEVVQLGTHTGYDSFAIDYSEITIEPTVLARTEILSTTVVSIGLPAGLETALVSILNEAIKLFEDQSTDNDIAAVNMLNAFLNKVNAKTGKDITESEADYLTGQVLDILSALAGDEKCPCWAFSDIYALPIDGTTADCVSDGYSRIDVLQVGICEHSYGVTVDVLDESLGCIAQRYDCPGFFDLDNGLETTPSEFAACLAQVIERCETLGIEPPEFP